LPTHSGVKNPPLPQHRRERIEVRVPTCQAWLQIPHPTAPQQQGALTLALSRE
jgi:hypothetical protein